MNTLQQRFPKVYQDFFSQCTKVASAPHSFFWFGDLAGIWGGLTIVQKLPMRFYVGLQPIEQSRFEVNPEFYAYSKGQDHFVKVQFDDLVVSGLKKLDLKGWRLQFLSEVEIGVSLGAIGALSAALTKLLHPNNNSKDFFKQAWAIARGLQNNKSSGASVYAAISEGVFPIAFSSEWPTFKAHDLGELSQAKGNPVWPIDFALLFSGDIVKGESVLRSIETAKDQLDYPESEAAKVASFSGVSGWEAYLGMLNTVSQEGLRTLIELLRKGSQLEHIERLFDLMNQYQNLLQFVRLSTPQVDEIYGAVHQLSNKSKNRVGSGAKITGIGKGGEVLVALPFGSTREPLERWLSSTDFELHYASWRDGTEIEGVTIEQDIEAKQYSDLLQSDLVELKVWDDHRFSTCLIAYDDIKPKDFDLLLDAVHNKVFIKGKPVDSTKLPSQKATVAIIGKLLESDEWKLPNTEIPLETYANSRYDLHGKVVIPFERAFTNGNKAGFALKVTGDLYDNYVLKLEANRLKTALVKRPR